MQQSLVRLIYRSRSHLAPDDVVGLDSIYRISVMNNLRYKVTGCLASAEGRFVQVLEGEAEVIGLLMKNLIVDTRHTDLVVLDQRFIQCRFFSQWAMARPKLETLSKQSLQLASDRCDSEQVISMLLDLVERGEALYPYH